MAKLTLPVQPDTCPFLRGAALLLEGQRARIHAVGEGERAEIDVRCIQGNCMMWNTTAVKDGKPIGGCGVAVGPAFQAQINAGIDGLNGRVNAVAFAIMGAAEKRHDNGGEFIDHLGALLRPLFSEVPQDDAPATVPPPKLEAVHDND